MGRGEVPAIGAALKGADRGIAFQFGDVTNPGSMVAGFDVWRETLEHLARVTNEGGVNLRVLVDYGAVYFNGNFAGALGVSAQITSDSVIKTHAHGNQEVGFLNGVVPPGFAVHAHHAEIQGIIGREAADTEERHRDGIIARADELLKGPHRAGNHDSMAGENDGPLRGGEHLDGAGEFRLIVIGAHALRWQVRCARTRGGHGYTDSTAGARVAVSHVRGALFVAHENVVQLGFAEGIIDRKNRAAGIAEDFTHAKTRERFAKDFSTGELHRVLASGDRKAVDEFKAG